MATTDNSSVWSDLFEKVGEILFTQVSEGVPVYHLLIESVLFLLLTLVYLLPRVNKNIKSAADTLSETEEDEMIAEWTPDPLAEEFTDTHGPLEKNLTVSGAVGTHVLINGESKLNLGSFNFLGFVGNKEIEDVSIKAARQYGIGSCGPRGFYGTIDCHLELEKRLAEFVGAEEAILYSYGFSTISSVIPAYCKRGDVVFYDKSISFAIQKGLIASRSKLVGFEHNDMAHLESLLKKQQAEEEKDPKKAAVTRKFIVVEGLYEYTGQIAPLDKLVDLKFEYKVRLFVEESMSFGVLGKTGRGITEHFGIGIDKIDAIAAGMGTALGSIGGFACGRSYVIDHQRLSGAGYCYSASLPPLLASAAIKALSMIVDSKGALQSQLAANSKLVFDAAKDIQGMEMFGSPTTPVLHLRLSQHSLTRREQQDVLAEIVDECLEHGIALVQPQYIVDQEFFPPLPSIRLVVSAGHTTSELTKALKVVSSTVARVLELSTTVVPGTPEAPTTRVYSPRLTRSQARSKRSN
eukprot:m.138379 g.138379  ORF g.138379 m.138379 type:complete len:521 (-) comp29989_c0_seq1:143-1705(-)